MYRYIGIYGSALEREYSTLDELTALLPNDDVRYGWGYGGGLSDLMCFFLLYLIY